MAIITAIYENGVFRPTGPVDLPEGATVRVEPTPLLPPEPGDPPELIGRVNVRALMPPGADEALIRVYEVLGRRYSSGHHDTAERHNEHQP